ncbi:hypothetical protein BGX29_011428 [Mortierella sp. GBA35]|nr:hypothetical protein BGX29_011428 [Mortierella sp. GBA35]
METAARKVFSLPELIPMVVQLLDSNARLQLSMTDRLLHQAISPLLWLTLDLLDMERANRHLLSPDAQRTLSRNINNVHHHKIRSRFLVHLVDSMIQYDPPSTTRSSFAVSSATSSTISHPLSVPSWLPRSPPLPNPLTVAVPWMTQLVSLEHVSEPMIIDDRDTTVVYSRVSGLRELLWLRHLNPSCENRLNFRPSSEP